MNLEEASFGNIIIDNITSSLHGSTLDENTNKRLLQGLNSWKIERIRLKDLIKSLKSRLNKKALSLATAQASLADVLIVKVGEETTNAEKQIHKLAKELKDCLTICENELQELQAERDNYAFDIAVLEEKITTCTLLAEEQDDFIQNQLETIQKLKSKSK